MKKVLLSILCICTLLISQEDMREQAPQTTPTQDKPTESIDKNGFVLGLEATFGTITMREGGVQNTNSMVMGGILAGYQYYVTQDFGMRALMTIHDSTMASVQTQSVLPFWIGTEFDLLWDYFQEGNHTLGLSIGLGYNAEIYHNYLINNQSLAFFTQHDLFPTFALHYYYDKHQIQIGYRFIETLKIPNRTISFQNQKLNPSVSYTNYLSLTYFYRF
ncbi:hypothetical protein BBW65_04210 [Helicobacter enhydrae]|uniref:Outer membrane beta-barrel protein n=1 Tax=Helicobacter enhydrae TaxID=222136 RepID=A0A1B1U5K3_9HELI|nr:hypothetical protein [Helicobacter enhydrae]ANV98053.1 hypothetical protein BBW65_04210 [Helicobacter enhydrae]